MKKALKAVVEFCRTHPVYVYGVAASLLPVLGYYGLDLPEEVWLPLFGAVLFIGGKITKDRVTPEPRVRAREDLAYKRGVVDVKNMKDHPSTQQD